ncbi:MAG: hypothetical protein Q7R76_02965 [Candidatus Woesearchaeota archaeon]|nr:hypothetical protein [Candidatus Woesearchaeota archaeon]
MNTRTYWGAALLALGLGTASCGGEEAPQRANTGEVKTVTVTVQNVPAQFRVIHHSATPEQSVPSVEPAEKSEPSDPSSLVRRVLDLYRDDPAPLRNAAARDGLPTNYRSDAWKSRVHLLRMAGDANEAEKILVKVFIQQPYFENEVLKFGFSPTGDHYRKRGAYVLQNKPDSSSEFDTAFDAFEKGGGEQGLRGKYRVAQLCEERAEKEGKTEFDMAAAKYYHKLGETDTALRLAKRAFARTETFHFKPEDWAKDFFGKGESLVLTPDFYEARGDFWTENAQQKRYAAREKAAEAYAKSGNAQKAAAFFDAKKDDLRWADDTLVIELAKTAGRTDVAIDMLVNGYIAEQALAEKGVPIDAKIYQRIGENRLEDGRYHDAFDAFKKADDEAGMRRVYNAYTAPIAAQAK